MIRYAFRENNRTWNDAALTTLGVGAWARPTLLASSVPCAGGERGGGLGRRKLAARAARAVRRRHRGNGPASRSVSHDAVPIEPGGLRPRVHLLRNGTPRVVASARGGRNRLGAGWPPTFSGIEGGPLLFRTSFSWAWASPSTTSMRCSAPFAFSPILGPSASLRVTVSTVGVVEKLRAFFEGCRAELAVSINATDDDLRSAMMPINRRTPRPVSLARRSRNAPRGPPRSVRVCALRRRSARRARRCRLALRAHGWVDRPRQCDPGKPRPRPWPATALSVASRGVREQAVGPPA